MPNQIHRAPRGRDHHQTADASRAPARTVSATGSSGLQISRHCRTPLSEAAAGRASTPARRGAIAVRSGASGHQSEGALRVGCRLGEVVGVVAGVDRVQHGELGVLDRLVGEVEGFGGVVLGPVRVVGGDLGVHLAGALRDVCLDVAHLGRGVSLRLRPLRFGAVAGLGDLLPCASTDWSSSAWARSIRSLSCASDSAAAACTADLAAATRCCRPSSRWEKFVCCVMSITSMRLPAGPGVSQY